MNDEERDELVELGPVPTDWGADPVSEYLDRLRRNQLASFQQLPGWFSRLRDLDRLFLKLAHNLDNTQQTAPALFFYRSHAAFRAALGLVLAGQIVEVYAMLRNCLEHALYGYFIFKEPSRWDIWQARNDSADARKKVRTNFKISDMTGALRADFAVDGNVLENLYENTIDFGAHPNSFGLFQGLTVKEEADATQMITQYLSCGTLAHQAALKETARVGVATLGTFGHIFDPRFSILGLWDELKPLKAGL